MSLVIKPPTVQASLKAMVVGGRGYGISHAWDGTVLTVTSDSGSSSADLKGAAGEMTVVTLSEQVDGTYVADLSFGEMVKALGENKLLVSRMVLANGNEAFGQLALVSPQMISFSTYMEFGQLNLCVFCHVFSDDRVVLSYPASCEEDLPYQIFASKEDSVVTVTASYSDYRDVETVIELDEEGVPVRVTKNGQSCNLQWEGFDA